LKILGLCYGLDKYLPKAHVVMAWSPALRAILRDEVLREAFRSLRGIHSKGMWELGPFFFLAMRESTACVALQGVQHWPVNGTVNLVKGHRETVEVGGWI
jgi:hypothetical protein